MALIKKADVALPEVLPEEEVHVEVLGGSVIVTGAGLGHRLSMAFGKDNAGKPFGHISRLLAVCVLDADRQPLYTADQWEVFAIKRENYQAAVLLWDVANRLSDLDGKEAEKNAEAPNSD